MPRKPEGLVSFKVTGIPQVSRAIRGLGDPNVVRMDELNKRASEIYLEDAKQEAPKRTYALHDSGKVLRGRGHTYNASFGDSRVDYVPAVLVGNGRTKPNHFLWRAKKKSLPARRKVYEEGMAKVIAARKLNRRR